MLPHTDTGADDRASHQPSHYPARTGLLRRLSFSPIQEGRWFLSQQQGVVSGVQFNQLAQRESENRAQAMRFCLALGASLSIFAFGGVQTGQPVVSGCCAVFMGALGLGARRERQRQIFWRYVSEVERKHGLSTAYRFLQASPTRSQELS